MKHPFFTLSRLAVLLTGALALGSCSRAEYAFLPKSASYLGTTTVAPQARIVPPTPAPETQVPAAVAPEITVATTPVASALVAAVAPRPVAAPTPPAPAEAAAAPQVATVATPAPQKLNLMQRLAVNKVLRKLEKQTRKITAYQGDNTASTTRSGLDSKLRYAIIFGAIGLIFLLFSGSLANTLATIAFIIAILFLLFWLLDNL